MDRPLVVIDAENAVPQGAPHLLELGAVRVVDGEIVETFEELVCPPVPIDPVTTGIHGIGDEDVRKAPFAPDVLRKFTAWVGDDWLAAHNAGADTALLGFEYARCGEEPPPGPFLDSLKLAGKLIPESHDHKLDTLVQHLELEDTDRHRALADAVSCWKVLEECFERQGGLASVKLAEWLAKCGAPVTIAGRFPGPPKLSPRLRPLERAVASGTPVTLLYGDSDGAPVPLPVHPLFLYERHGKSYLEGECGPSGLLKTYLLDRIRKVLE